MRSISVTGQTVSYGRRESFNGVGLGTKSDVLGESVQRPPHRPELERKKKYR